ncbi:pyruvate decarboxylase [Exophiala viscosa]|uniref:Pyruvate decarboxylase n=1 Tax=Exophiala viscosa TaxID=2486360 RepID=A0AAN6IGP3_9EURO|nr:pyruvate decarboxylase [Exophiala viscosa]
MGSITMHQEDDFVHQTRRIPIGAYIFHRLHQIGVSHVFGCPGDFNLNLLDHLYTVPSMKWIGTCNELNGAYAADGYARVRGIPGVLITTYGVGELSAINGIAGAYSEHVPIIHIVGTTSRLARRDRIMIRHTLDENWDHDTFQKMSEPVRTGHAFLLEDSNFTKDIDNVIQTCVQTRRPVYLYVPIDVPDILVNSEPLQKPLHFDITNHDRDHEEDEFIDEAVKMLAAAEHPVALVDMLTHRYGLVNETKQFLSLTGLQAFVTPLTKSVVDETSEHYGGLYNGKLSPSIGVQKRVESSDAVFHIGPFPSDSNTGGWSQKLQTANLICLSWNKVSVRDRVWHGLNFVPIVKKLVRRLELQKFSLKNTLALEDCLSTSAPLTAPTEASDQLDQLHVWRKFSPFLREGDCIIAEVGSAQYGTLELELPANVTFFTQLYYSCIGFTVGALLGALVAQREQGNNGRAWLFVGDGSLQMTVQELSTIIRYDFKPTIVLINNSGYTIERVIHGPLKHYNEISTSWDYQNMLRFFGAGPATSATYSARTYRELAAVLEDKTFQTNSTIQLLELVLDKFDTPWMLSGQINIVHEESTGWKPMEERV